MELYTFFSEPVDSNDKGKVKRLSDLKYQLALLPGIDVKILSQKFGGVLFFVVAGICEGQDTNIGYTALMMEFNDADIKYTWVDSFCPQINNLKD